MEIKTQRDAILFDQYLSDFQKRNDVTPLNLLSMENVFGFLKTQGDQGRLFTYMLDLQIQFALLNIDSWQMTKLDREIKAIEHFGGLDIFCNRTALLKVNSDFIFRYRAIWDKIMGIFILLFSPDDFQSFSRAKSRKKTFEKIFKKNQKLPDHIQNSIVTTITDFDDLYRTAEIHGSGSTRKWSYDYSESPFSNQANMDWAWNAIIPIITNIGDFFRNSYQYIKNATK